jgi:hypothetical protein
VRARRAVGGFGAAQRAGRDWTRVRRRPARARSQAARRSRCVGSDSKSCRLAWKFEACCASCVFQTLAWMAPRTGAFSSFDLLLVLAGVVGCCGRPGPTTQIVGQCKATTVCTDAKRGMREDNCVAFRVP